VPDPAEPLVEADESPEPLEPPAPELVDAELDDAPAEAVGAPSFESEQAASASAMIAAQQKDFMETSA
jgi:hypothetical protein